MQFARSCIHFGLATGLLLVAARATCAEPSNAQAAPAATTPPAAKPTPPPVTEIVVTGERPAVENAIDRKIYSVSQDLLATSGSAADVLRNLPSVTVDLDGNPSLRGDSSVTILVDGRLAPEFNGANRGAALQQLGAANIDRIEVLTNPPANFKRDGAAGIINIITKRRTGARSASAQASLGSFGRYNVGGSAGRQVGKVQLRGSASLRHDQRKRDIDDERVTFDEEGVAIDSRNTRSVGDDDRLSRNLSLGADLELTDVDRLTAEGSFYRREEDSFLREHALTFDNAGARTSEYTRTRRGAPYEYTSTAQVRYHHKGANDGDGLTLNVERSDSAESGLMRYLKHFTSPAQPDTAQDQRYREGHLTEELSADWVATLASESKFSAGYDLTRDSYLFDHAQTFTVPAGSAMPPDPSYTNLFRYSQTIHALYGSYEFTVGAWTWLPGVRLEQAYLDINQVTTGEQADQSYFLAYPSLHVRRKLGEWRSLKISTSRRVFRPEGEDLNPFRVQVNEFAVRAGNPDLEPVKIDMVEVELSHDEGRTSRSVSVYARRAKDSRTTLTTLISPTVTLTTPANLGESVSGGLELTAAGRLGEKVDYNLSSVTFYTQLHAGNLGFTEERSAYTTDAKAALNWRMSDKDTLQVNAALRGRRVTPQGYLPSNATMDLGYRRQLRKNLSLTATVTDVFDTKKLMIITETPELEQTQTLRPTGRIVFVGVSWTLPGAKKAPEKFEYEQAE